MLTCACDGEGDVCVCVCLIDRSMVRRDSSQSECEP